LLNLFSARLPVFVVAFSNLASAALPMFIKNKTFDHQLLFSVVYQMTKNLNRVIDVNYYPVEQGESALCMDVKVKMLELLTISLVIRCLRVISPQHATRT
jgi:hypothetical protein